MAVDELVINMEAAEDGHDSCIHGPTDGLGGELPASRRCRVRFADKDPAIEEGVMQSGGIAGSHGGMLGAVSSSGRGKMERLRELPPKQSNDITRRRTNMNLAIRGIDAETFPCVQHRDLRADHVLANGRRSLSHSGVCSARKRIGTAEGQTAELANPQLPNGHPPRGRHGCDPRASAVQ